MVMAEETDSYPRSEQRQYHQRRQHGLLHGLAAGSQLEVHIPTHRLPARSSSPILWYDPCAFTIQAAGFVGTEPRGLLRGPGLTNVDMSIVKDTAVRKLAMQRQVEFSSRVLSISSMTRFSLCRMRLTISSVAIARCRDLTQRILRVAR